MNQILYTGGNDKKGKTTDLKKIVIFFVIFIIIFAIAIIGVGANLLNKVKNKNTENPNNNIVGSNTTNTSPETPVKSNIKIKLEPEVGAVKVIITSDIALESVSYWWNEEEATTVEVTEKEYEVVVTSRQGAHTLKIEATDENGYTKELSQLVIGDAGPEVKISTDGVSNYVIKATDDEKVEKIVIVLNGETQEVKANGKEFEYKVAIPRGDSIIEVTAYNLNGLTTTKKAKITNFGR